MTWSNRDEDWKNANSLFQRRFLCRRRPPILRSLLLTKRGDLLLERFKTTGIHLKLNLLIPTGGPLGDNTFKLLQFHVHFGCTYVRGSEHKLDGSQLSGHVNVTTMWGFFFLHLTYRYFSFLISWPAGYLCLGKPFQWSITFSIFSAEPYYSHLKSISPKLTWVISQAGLAYTIGVCCICICFKLRSRSHCDLLLVIGEVIDNLWVHAGAVLS